jgi:adenine-specific DNA methylase
MGALLTTEENLIKNEIINKESDNKDGILIINNKEIDNKDDILVDTTSIKDDIIKVETYLISIDQIGKCIFENENNAIQYVMDYSKKYMNDHYLVEVINNDDNITIYNIMKPLFNFIMNYEILVSSITITKLPYYKH